GLLELGVGRRLSLFAGMLRRWNGISSDPHAGTLDEELQLANIGEEKRWHFGVGGQYDFYVVPHGSIGLRLYLEQDYGMISFAMALEPKPKQKMTLNYNGL